MRKTCSETPPGEPAAQRPRWTALACVQADSASLQSGDKRQGCGRGEATGI